MYYHFTCMEIFTTKKINSNIAFEYIFLKILVIFLNFFLKILLLFLMYIFIILQKIHFII